jgi:hypothetical protein
MDVNDQFHAPAALTTTKEFRYTLDRDWVDPKFGLDVAEKKKPLPLRGIELRLLGRPVCGLVGVVKSY